MKKTILLFLLIIGSFFVVVGCKEKEKPNESAIKSFSYHYGGYNSGYYDYTIKYEDDKLVFIASGANGVDLDIHTEIDKAKLEELAKLINDKKIYEWNGFARYDKDVYDGYGFSLRVIYEDGGFLTADGYMKYPDNYDEGHAALVAFLEALYK